MKFFTKKTVDESSEDIFKDDGSQLWIIPKDEENSDYQAYLKWLDEQ